jgi:molybdenum cofactor cytidylyltransferase
MFRSFAIVPAAGRSERMGVPKLLLPWGGSTVIESVLAAWTASHVSRTVVVVRADDMALLERVRRFDVDVVQPGDPPRDMKASVQLALVHLAERYAPSDADAWLVAPADLPRLLTAVIDRLLDAHRPDAPAVIVPTHRAERGHPTLLPWSLAREVHNLGDSEGINVLVDRVGIRELASDHAGILDDLNLPWDYERLTAEGGGQPRDETGGS